MIKPVRHNLSFLGLMLVVLFCSSPLRAQSMLTVRAPVSFEQALAEAEYRIAEHGYKVAHIQRCDGGLKDFGYKSDFYRILFFGKLDEVQQLSEKYPQLAPFLPLKMLVFAENDDTILVAVNPLNLANFIDDSQVHAQLNQWNEDIESIFTQMHQLKRLAE